MKAPFALLLCSGLGGYAAAPFGISSLSSSGTFTFTNTFPNGVCTVEQADEWPGPWRPVQNVFTTATTASASLVPPDPTGFYRAIARDLGGGRAGFTNLTQSYGLLTTIAGAGGPQDVNNWLPEYEGGPATSAVLSGPHIAMADRAGNIYIADKDAHGIRKIRLDGTIITVAGTSVPGNGSDAPTSGTSIALSGPNGLWVRGDGTLYILDTDNSKVRRLDTNGTMETLFAVPGGVAAGRGLWVNDDETLAYVSSLSVVKKWTAQDGVTDFATDFAQLGNLVVDGAGNVLVTDRGGHRVYRLDPDGNRTVIAGNGGTAGGGDGMLATETALEEVRGVWLLPSGAFLVCTHRSSRVWYVDTEGYIHLFLNGNRNGAHAGDGTWFYEPNEARVSECRAITMDYEGNLLITENDVGFVRKVRFLPFTP
jgi:sugar lactone lactonase YvrE